MMCKQKCKIIPVLNYISNMKNVVFWDVTQCGSCKNQRFGGTYDLHYQSKRISEIGTTC
jgi:hypothetical protein